MPRAFFCPMSTTSFSLCGHCTSLFVTALGRETFPLFRNERTGFFSVDTYKAGIGFASLGMSGWGSGIYDFDNDAFKDVFSANSHASENADEEYEQQYRQTNAVFLNAHNGTFRNVNMFAGPDMQVGPHIAGARSAISITTVRLTWLCQLLAMAPNCFTTPQRTATIGF
jgi:hypothetical protein